MSTFARRMTLTAAGLAAGAALLVAGASTATAAPAHANAVECGFMHVDGETSYYNHCGTGNVEIQVDHFFWNLDGATYFCAHPGIQVIPQGNDPWAITGAEWDGNYC